jgi:hypothetical protein
MKVIGKRRGERWRESKEKEARRARNLVVNTTVFRSEEVTFGDKNDDSSHDSSNESYNRVSLSLSLCLTVFCEEIGHRAESLGDHHDLHWIAISEIIFK